MRNIEFHLLEYEMLCQENLLHFNKIFLLSNFNVSQVTNYSYRNMKPECVLY